MRIFSLSPCLQWTSLYFLIFASLMGINRYLAFNSICIFMVTKEIQNFLHWQFGYTILWIVYMHFSIWLFDIFMICKTSLYIIDQGFPVLFTSWHSGNYNFMSSWYKWTKKLPMTGLDQPEDSSSLPTER